MFVDLEEQQHNLQSQLDSWKQKSEQDGQLDKVIQQEKDQLQDKVSKHYGILLFQSSIGIEII